MHGGPTRRARIRYASGGFELPRLALALVRIEEPLSYPYRLRRDLDQLVVLDVGDRLFQAHSARRGQADAFVLRARGAEVGELLGLEGIDLEVLGLGVLADDHALVEHLPGGDEQHAAVFERAQRIGDRWPLLHRDQHAVLAAGNRALVRAVAFEQAVHDAGAAGVGQELAVIADQAAARRAEG